MNSSYSYNSESPKNALELMYSLHDNAIEVLANQDLQLLKNKFTNNLVVVRPEIDLFVNNLDFNKSKMLQNFNNGKEHYEKNEINMFKA